MRFFGPLSSVTSLLAAVGTLLACSTAYASTNTGVGTSEQSEGPRVPQRIQFVLGLPVTYTLHGGSYFDGHHGYSFDENRVAHLPKLAGGFGIRPSVGVLFEHLVSNLSAMASFNLQWSRHDAASYNAGNSAYAHEAATLTNGSLDLRAILEVPWVKPYIALSPGYGWLSLPEGVTVVDPTTRNTTWSNVTFRGFTLEATLGATVQFSDWMSAGAGIGYRLHRYTASNVAPVAGLGSSPGLVMSLGVNIYL